jgi:hypothetical protein
MAQYPNLPGIEVNIADGGLILPEDTSTESMLIIAPSLNASAPTEPVLVRQSSDLDTNNFGTFVINGQVNPIAASWKAAYEGGCRRIYLMAYTGADDASKFLSIQDAMFGILADFTVNHVVLVGVSADVEATLASLPATSDGVKQKFSVTGATTLTFPVTVTAGTNDTIKIGTQTMTLKAGSYATQDLFLAEVENEIAVAGLDMTAEVVGGKLVLSESVAFSLVTGTNAAGLAAGAAVQSIKGNFALLAGAYAESQTLNHNSTIAYVGTSAPAGSTLAQVKTQVDMLTGIDNEYSGYVQVVAGPELGYMLPGKSDIYYANGAVSYAALVSTLAAESAPTNKRVYGVAGMRYNLSLRQLNSLTGNKFVTFRLKGNQVVVTDGCTTAPDYMLGGVKQTSDFARLSTLRITQAATQLIRNITEPYIGEPNRMPQYNSFNATVKNGLESMKAAGAIMDYNFTVTATSGTLSEATVTLQLIPAFEMKRITVNVALKPPYSLS